MAQLETTLARLRERFPNAITDIYEFRGDATIAIPRESLLDVARFLRDDPALRFASVMDITALDWLPRDPRFDVLYWLLALDAGARVRLRVRVAE